MSKTSAPLPHSSKPIEKYDELNFYIDGSLRLSILAAIANWDKKILLCGYLVLDALPVNTVIIETLDNRYIKFRLPDNCLNTDLCSQFNVELELIDESIA